MGGTFWLARDTHLGVDCHGVLVDELHTGLDDGLHGTGIAGRSHSAAVGVSRVSRLEQLRWIEDIFCWMSSAVDAEEAPAQCTSKMGVPIGFSSW